MLLGLAPQSRAALVDGTLEFAAQADQSIIITDNSPLTGTPFDIPAGTIFPLSARGSISLGWEADADGDASVAVTSFSAEFFELHQALGPYSLSAIGNGPGAGFTGRLDNVEETGGILISADWTLSTTFSLTFTGVPGQPTIYTKDQATFTGKVRGGNAIIGEVFTSSGLVDGYLSLGNPATDPLAARSFNRTVTAVPEPSSLSMLAVASLVGVGYRRRRRLPS